MLNGLDPIFIFNFSKRPPAVGQSSSIPILPTLGELIPLPSIPVYLSERLTGVVITSEEKNIEVQTDVDATTDGTQGQIHQRPIQSTITINLATKVSSIGAATILALSDLLLPLVTAKEYSITYLHGATTIFNGLLNSFQVFQRDGTDLYEMQISLIKPAPGSKKTTFEAPRNPAIPVGTVLIGGGS